MPTKMFVHFPVHDLKQSMEFFATLGFTFNPQFTDDTAACMVVGEESYVMLLTHNKFTILTPKALCDAATRTEVLVALSAESRAHVDAMVRKAVAAGGTTSSAPQDHGLMYGHGFQDLDGHRWEVFSVLPTGVLDFSSRFRYIRPLIHLPRTGRLMIALSGVRRVSTPQTSQLSPKNSSEP